MAKAIAQANSKPCTWRCQDGRHSRLSAPGLAAKTCCVLLMPASSYPIGRLPKLASRLDSDERRRLVGNSEAAGLASAAPAEGAAGGLTSGAAGSETGPEGQPLTPPIVRPAVMRRRNA